MTDYRSEHWEKRIAALAEFGHEALFPERWGSQFMNGEDAVWIFNNWPYCDRATRRDKQLAAFRISLAAHGLEEVAYAEFPRGGSSEGYSYSIMVRATKDQHEMIRDMYNDSLDVGWDDE